ncbi:hypothetical protein LVJ94_14320 [Pendulispora rubella]|uniref:Uncharacterized protein n=1 Tax=Pendulispora rubella TaxID=2741070 RepID=A0ABZ2LBU9_9BACT
MRSFRKSWAYLGAIGFVAGTSWVVACSSDGGGGGPISRPDAGPDAGGKPSPLCTSAHFCLEYPSVAWENLHALVTTAGGDLWAAGDYGVLLHMPKGAQTWTRMASPVSASLRAAAVTGERVFFVGDQGTVVRWDGHQLTVDTLESRVDLRSVWAASENDVWAVGGWSSADAGSSGVIWRFDGSRWSPFASATSAIIESVHGSGPNDVWMASKQGVYHVVDGVLQTVLSVQKSHPRIWARSPREVFLSSSGYPPQIERFDGTNWTNEVLEVPVRVEGFVPAPDGALWAAATPLMRREANGVWKSAPDVQAFKYGEVQVHAEALGFREGEPFVAGEKGLLFRAKDVFHEAMTSGFQYAKAFPAGSILQSGSSMLTYDTQGFHRIHTSDRVGGNVWVAANAWNDVFFAVSGSSQWDGALTVERYDGAQVKKVYAGGGTYDHYWPLELAANGDLYLGYTNTGMHAPYPTQLDKLPASSTKSARAGCGYGWPCRIIGSELLLQSENGAGRHLAPDGRCEEAPFAWSDVSGPNYQNVYTLRNDNGTSIFGHFDGAQWKELARPEGKYCGVFYLADNDVWLKSCGGPRHMLRWNGQTFEKLPIGLPEGEGDISLVFGTDPEHLWVADSGRIFRYKP